MPELFSSPQQLQGSNVGRESVSFSELTWWESFNLQVHVITVIFRTNGLKKQLEILIAGRHHRELTAQNLEDLGDGADLKKSFPFDK